MWWLVACASIDPVPASLAPPVEDRAPSIARGALSFRFPLVERELFEQTVGMDHDPVTHDEGFEGEIQCTNYDGRAFPWCYDGHDGSDYLLIGGFDAMDAGSAVIVAAADGIVVETADGNYDRCEASFTGVDCDGFPMEPNYVIVEHDGGWRTMYWHMMKESVAVAVGDTVRCGDPLGLVGSSGYSSMPHLHFEVKDQDGVTFDPYAGAFSQEETWWLDQGGPEGLPGSDCALE